MSSRPASIVSGMGRLLTYGSGVLHRGSSPTPVGAQFALHQLASRGTGQRGDELNRARDLVTSDAVADIVRDRVRQLAVGGGARCRHDEGRDRFAHLFVRQPDDGDVVHSRVECETALDLLGIDVDATGDDRERLAIGQIQIVLAVRLADVTCGCPGLVHRVLCLGRLRGVVVVLEGKLVPLEIDGANASGG